MAGEIGAVAEGETLGKSGAMAKEEDVTAGKTGAVAGDGSTGV